MKVLVTGVSGRLGPHMVRDLIKAGHEVVLFSRRPPGEEFSRGPADRRQRPRRAPANGAR